MGGVLRSEMRKLFDEAGNAVEVPDDSELQALKTAKEEAEQLKKDLDKNAGVKNLREALARKEARIQSLEASTAKKEEPKAQPTYEAVSDDDIRKTASQAAVRALMEVEIGRKLSDYDDEERTTVKKVFDKLVAGEELNMETMPVFLAQAESAAFPDRQRNTSVARSGRPPRQSEEKKQGYGDTDDGKAFAASLGLNIDPPPAKKK